MQAQAARMDREAAVVGTTVYPGDSFDTDAGGSLRLRLGASELSLDSRSAAVVGNAAQVKIGEGTLEFSSVVASPLAIETPIAMVRAAAGQAAAGDVTLTGPKSILVHAAHGALVVERDGETHTIEEGKSYDISMEPAEPMAAAAAQNGQGVGFVGTSHPHHGQLIFKAVVIGTAAVVAYCLWGTTESPSGFCN